MNDHLLSPQRIKLLKRTILILSILGILFVHFYAPRFITEINNPLIKWVKKVYIKSPKLSFDKHQGNGRYIYFKSFDDINLSAYITYSKLDSVKGTIILLHGIRATKENFIDLSKKLSELGYNSIALDARAHGQSGGKHCTFGVKEKKDIQELISVLEKTEGITKNIGIWGQSLGGAIALQAMGVDLRIKFGIIESTFTDFKKITNDYFKFHLGFNSRPFTNYLVNRAGKIAGFAPDEAMPSKYCRKIEQAIIIVHGNKDRRINIKYGRENFSKISSTDKEFIEIKNANHLNVWEIGGDKYFEKVISFMDKNSF